MSLHLKPAPATSNSLPMCLFRRLFWSWRGGRMPSRLGRVEIGVVVDLGTKSSELSHRFPGREEGPGA